MNRPISPFVLVAARLLMGAVFLYLGAVKAFDPVGFLKLVREFHVVESPLALNVTAALLPWLEIFCGGLLILGVKPRAAALLQLVLLVAFTAAVFFRAWHLHRAGAAPFCAIHFDCGCGNGEVLVCMKLLENAGLTVLAALVAFVPCDRWATWPDRRSSG